MSVLSWLYVAGVALVGVPIFLHMIRRTPHGKVPFSTLMFLQPSPPRMTHRSRIEHWLLLLLRALAVVLIALAFARPYWRETEQQTLTKGGRRVALLIDVSASLQRTGMWAQSNDRVASVLKELGATDSLAVFAFDTALTPVLRFDEWEQLAADARRPVLDERLKTLAPNWKGTDLGHALSEAVAAVAERGSGKQPKSVELVVVSDFQQGGRIESLQQFQWPDGIVVRPEFLKAKSENNAGLHAAASVSREEVKARIENSIDATAERFGVTVEAVGNATAEVPGRQEAVIPPGQSRVLKVGEIDSSTAWRVVLSGDDEPFDNTVWVSKAAPRRVTVAYYGNEAADDPKALRFFLERAFLPTPEREVEFLAYSPGQPVLASDRPVLAFVSSPQDATVLQTLGKQIEDGLRVVVIARDDEMTRLAVALAGHEPVDVSEAKLGNYAMLTSVDFEHPLFSEFSDAKLADFTKLPIWKHRVIDAKALKGGRVLAQFDGESSPPALVELPRGTGSVIVSLFGWHGDDSRFVLWSKFVPMVNHLLTHSLGTAPQPRGLMVGDRLPLALGEKECRIKLPSGEVRTVATSEQFLTTEPGLYVVTVPDAEPSVWAVNLDPLESRTTSLRPDELKTLGLPLTEMAAASTDEERRQLQSRELEERQKYWQWLISAGIVVLMLETWLAGKTTRQQAVME